MRLIHVDAVNEHDEFGGARTWLVIADTLFQAMSLIPAGHRPRDAVVRAGTVSGPARVIGWLGAPAVLGAVLRPERNIILCVAETKTAAAARANARAWPLTREGEFS